MQYFLDEKQFPALSWPFIEKKPLLDPAQEILANIEPSIFPYR